MARAEAGLRVEVVYCAGPGRCDSVELRLPCGATVAEAIAASGLALRHGLEATGGRVGVWGRLRDAAAPLNDGDRVEIYRPLQVDPKEARRKRQRRQQVAAGA